jgi:hypothetical protein
MLTILTSADGGRDYLPVLLLTLRFVDVHYPRLLAVHIFSQTWGDLRIKWPLLFYFLLINPKKRTEYEREKIIKNQHLIQINRTAKLAETYKIKTKSYFCSWEINVCHGINMDTCVYTNFRPKMFLEQFRYKKLKSWNFPLHILQKILDVAELKNKDYYKKKKN